MRTIKIAVYKFDELSEKAKQAVLINLADINIFEGFGHNNYEMANLDGITIESTDLDKKLIKGKLQENTEVSEVANNILTNWGKDAPIYKLAEKFIKDCEDSFSHAEQFEDMADEDNFNNIMGLPPHLERVEVLEEQFLADYLKLYLNFLIEDNDFLTSDDSIIETIHANDYEFYENGQLIEVSQYLAN